MNTDITVLKHLTAIRLDVNIWSARKKLTPLDFTTPDLPPEHLASLGSKKVCNPEDLRIFGTLKGRAIALLDRHGVHFLGGWAIPETATKAIINGLDKVAADFSTAKDAFLARYDDAVHEWIATNPGYETLIARSVVSADTVRARLGFAWQMFKVVPPRKADAAQPLKEMVGNLGSTLFGEVAKVADEAWQKSFAGKQELSTKALSPLKGLRHKLAGLSFVEPRVTPMVDVLDTALAQMPDKGSIAGADLIMLQGLICLLRDPQAMVEHGQKIIDGQSADDILHSLTAMPVESVSAPFADEAEEDGNEDGDPALHVGQPGSMVRGRAMKTQAILHCLPLLADVLGRAYGVLVEIGGTEAFTTGRLIRLPNLPAQADAAFLGVVRGYMDHEAAHIRHTDFNAVAAENLTSLEKHIWNIFEDWRVEEKLSSRFPGCRQNFKWLIRHLFLKPHPQQSGMPPHQAVTDWLLLNVRSWVVPELQPRCQNLAQILDSHWPGLKGNLHPILARMHQHCPDSLACVHYARDVVQYLERYPDLHNLICSPSSDLPQDLGEMLQQVVGEKPQALGKCAVARVGHKQLRPLSPEDLKDIARVTAGLRARFHAMLQSTQRVRKLPAKTGRLDTSRLHGITFGKQNLFLAYGQKQAINTAVHILLDSSASMRSRMDLASLSCLAVAQALSQTGISVGLTTFPADEITAKGPTLAPILKHGEKPHTILRAEASGKTPLGEALWWVLQRLIAQPEQRKIVLILTDGEPDNPVTAQEAITTGSQAGVEIYGLGIAAPKIGDLLPHTSRNIDNLNELPAALFGLLQGAFRIEGRAA